MGLFTRLQWADNFTQLVAVLKELEAMDVAIVALVYNYAKVSNRDIVHYPAKFLGDGSLPDMIVVGSTNGNGRRAATSMESELMTTYAL